MTAVARLRGAVRESAPRLIVHDNGGVLSIAAFFVVMVVVFSLITDTFLTEANLLNILRQIAPLMIVAVAMTFVITTARDRPLGRLGSGARQCAGGDFAAGRALLAAGGRADARRRGRHRSRSGLLHRL